MLSLLLPALPDWLAILATVIAGAAVIEAARRANWRATPVEIRVWLLATLAVLIGQRMGIAFESGIHLHYLGSAFLALLVGYPRALLSMAAIALLGPLIAPHTLGADSALPALDPFRAWGLRVVVGGVIPIWSMWLLVQACKRWLPRNLFVFLLGCGLFGLVLCYGLQVLTSAALIALLQPETGVALAESVMPYALLLASGEAWLEGMVVTVLVVYVPGAVRLFDEGFYLRRA